MYITNKMITIKENLVTQFEQRFALTQGQQMSLYVLTLTHLELAGWLKQEIETNPLLEYNEESSPYEAHSSPCIYDDIPSAAPSLFEFLMQQAEHIFLMRANL